MGRKSSHSPKRIIVNVPEPSHARRVQSASLAGFECGWANRSRWSSKANPIAAVRAGALLLDYLGERYAAACIEQAVDAVLAAKVWTPDLGGSAQLEDVVDAIVGEM